MLSLTALSPPALQFKALQILPLQFSFRNILPQEEPSSRPFRENIKVVAFPFPFHVIKPLAKLWLTHLHAQHTILNIKRFTDLYPLIRPPIKPSALGSTRIFIPGIYLVPSYVSRLWRCPLSLAYVLQEVIFFYCSRIEGLLSSFSMWGVHVIFYTLFIDIFI